MIDLSKLTIKKAHESMKNGEFSARELSESYLKVISEKNPTMNAFIEVYDDVLAQADQADARFKSGTATMLTGIPIALKDNMLFKGKKVSSSSHILNDYVSTYDGTVVSLLKQEGAVLVGRTNMDEFAMGSSTETSYYGVTKNPYDLERVPGGSSGGAAAALAMDGVLASLGSDTGGSIRQPAAFCGLVGLHPTYGSISRYGLIAMGSSLDQIGPLTKNVEDAEILFKAISKYDKNDSTSILEEKRENKSSIKKKIGIPQSFLSGEGIHPEVLANFNQVVQKLKGAGYEIIDVSLPYTPYSLAVYYILMPAEASTNLSRFDGMRFGLREEGKDLFEEYSKTRGLGFGKEVRRRILLGTYVLSHGYYDAYYNKAILVRKEIEKELNSVLEQVDVILTPSTPTPAFKIGEKSKDPVSMYLSDIFTVPANIAKVPAISIPSGKTRDGLPLGIQLIGPKFGEDILFTIGKDFESLV